MSKSAVSNPFCDEDSLLRMLLKLYRPRLVPGIIFGHILLVRLVFIEYPQRYNKSRNFETLGAENQEPSLHAVNFCISEWEINDILL